MRVFLYLFIARTLAPSRHSGCVKPCCKALASLQCLSLGHLPTPSLTRLLGSGPSPIERPPAENVLPGHPQQGRGHAAVPGAEGRRGCFGADGQAFALRTLERSRALREIWPSCRLLSETPAVSQGHVGHSCSASLKSQNRFPTGAELWEEAQSLGQGPGGPWRGQGPAAPTQVGRCHLPGHWDVFQAPWCPGSVPCSQTTVSLCLGHRQVPSMGEVFVLLLPGWAELKTWT